MLITEGMNEQIGLEREDSELSVDDSIVENVETGKSKITIIPKDDPGALEKSLMESGILKKKWPMVGEVFAIKFSDIKSVSISRESQFDLSKFQWFISLGSLHGYDPNIRKLNSKLGNRYTLIKHEGGRVFTEFFTGTLIKLYVKNDASCSDFVEKVKNARSYPLMVDADDLVEVDDKVISDVISNDDEFIFEYINKLRNSSLELFDSQFGIMWKEDYKFAESEEKIKKFINRKNDLHK